MRAALLAATAALVALACAGVGALFAPRADAKYPGANGLIAFTRFDDTGAHVFVADRDGANARRLPPDDADLATWSPLGRA